MARTLNLVAYGRPIGPLSLNLGESTVLSFLVQDLAARTAVPLAGLPILFTLAARDLRGLPSLPAVISRAGVVTGDGTAGAFTVTLGPGDTSSLRPGLYLFGVQITGGDGAVTSYVPLSTLVLSATPGYAPV